MVYVSSRTILTLATSNQIVVMSQFVGVNRYLMAERSYPRELVAAPRFVSAHVADTTNIADCGTQTQRSAANGWAPQTSVQIRKWATCYQEIHLTESEFGGD